MTFNIGELPVEVAARIFSNLDDETILHASLVCHQWANILNSERFLTQLFGKYECASKLDAVVNRGHDSMHSPKMSTYGMAHYEFKPKSSLTGMVCCLHGVRVEPISSPQGIITPASASALRYAASLPENALILWTNVSSFARGLRVTVRCQLCDVDGFADLALDVMTLKDHKCVSDPASDLKLLSLQMLRAKSATNAMLVVENVSTVRIGERRNLSIEDVCFDVARESIGQFHTCYLLRLRYLPSSCCGLRIFSVSTSAGRAQ